MTILSMAEHVSQASENRQTPTSVRAPFGMPSRCLTILFQRDPSRDRQAGQIQFTGYNILWPDGRPVGVALDAFCTRGQRLLGLDRVLAGCHERLIDVLCFPLNGRDDRLVKIPGHRVRRFFLVRQGPSARLHFLDGTPTETTFEIGRDEDRVLDWIGLHDVEEGVPQWVDIAATATPSVALPAAA